MRIEPFIETVSDTQLVFRCFEENEGDILYAYRRQLFGETQFLGRYPDEAGDTEKSCEFIEKMNNDERSLLLGVFIGDILIGAGSFRPRTEYRSGEHRCSLGIAFLEEYTNFGYGRALLIQLINRAKSCGYRQMELHVNVRNDRAIHVYKSLGFEEYGKLPHGALFDDGHDDSIVSMVLFF